MAEPSSLVPIDRTSVTDQIVRRLASFILERGLRPGDRLPSERQLMLQLSVGRSSLREAVRALHALGVVEVAAGQGMFVGRGEESMLLHSLSWETLVGEQSTRELVEARRVVEVELAGMAAERATDTEVGAIGEQLEAMRALEDTAAMGSHDVEFHLAIGRAAHNRVLYRALDTLRHFLRAWVVRNYRGYQNSPASKLELLAEHGPIYEAIRRHDPQAARLAMAAHLAVAGERLESIVANARTDRQQGHKRAIDS